MHETKATQVAEEYLVELNREGSLDCVITHNQFEPGLGWLFFYTSRRFLETGAIRDALAGNAPFIVRDTGDITVLGTAHPTEFYLTELRKENKNA